MRAAIFESRETMVVRDVDPPAIDPGDALLRIRYCGICGSDLSLFKTGILAGPEGALGHEITAVVEEDTTGTFEHGARVVAWPVAACGSCVWCRDGYPKFCIDPPTPWRGFAEQVVVRAEHLIGVPDEVDDRSAALAEPLGIGVRAVEMAGVEGGDLTFVSGLGPIGLLVVAALRDRGARVIGADVREDRRALGERFGCELVFDPVAEDPWWKTLAVDLHGPRFAFECSGAPAAVQMAFNVCGHAGTVVLLGLPFEPAFFLPAVMSVKEQRAFSISGPTMDSMGAALDLLARRPDAAGIVTGVVPLESTGRAMLELARGGGSGGVKVLVDTNA